MGEKLTLLSYDHNLDNKTDIIYANATDMALITGCMCFNLDRNNFKENRKLNKAMYMFSTDNLMLKNNSNFLTSRSVGIRPVIDFESADKIPQNPGSKITKCEDDIYEVEYGFYPQEAPSDEVQNELNYLLQEDLLEKTDNAYTTDERLIWDCQPFSPETNEEYELKGRRYVRVKVNGRHPNDTVILSNGKEYKHGEYVWLEVKPVVWFVDEKLKKMISKDVLLAGIQYMNYGSKDCTFKKSNVYNFLEKYLSEELFQIKELNIDFGKSGNSKKNNKNLIVKDNNPFNFNFGRATEIDIIKAAIKADVSIFLHGKPGCGKSARIKELDPDFIELNLSHLDPELLDGIAGIKDGKAIHIKPPWLDEIEEKAKKEPDKIHILFLDELTNASDMMQKKAYGIALEKKVAGKWKLPENVRVVAAGNEIEDSIAANEMAEPLYDRFAHVNIKTTLNSWVEWAQSRNQKYQKLDYEKENIKRPKIHPAVYAFVASGGEKVLRTPFRKNRMEPHADPRRWEMASKMLYANDNPKLLKSIVGDKLTRDFVRFCKTQVISRDDILNENYTEEDIPKTKQEIWATIGSLAKTDVEDLTCVRNFVKKFGDNWCNEFDKLWISSNREISDRKEILKKIKDREKNKHKIFETKSCLINGIIACKDISNKFKNIFIKQEEKNYEKGA